MDAWSDWLPDTADPSAEGSFGRPVSENARDAARDRCSAICSLLVSSSTCFSSSRIRLRRRFYQRCQITPPVGEVEDRHGDSSARTSWGPSSCPRGLARRSRSPASQPDTLNTVRHRARRTDDINFIRMLVSNLSCKRRAYFCLPDFAVITRPLLPPGLERPALLRLGGQLRLDGAVAMAGVGRRLSR